MYKVKVNKEILKNHLHYDLWKYGLGILITIFAWSMLVTITEPQTPADKKVDIYLVGGYMDEDGAKELSEKMLPDFPELLEINFYNIMTEAEMEYAGRQKLIALIGSQTGDIYAFNKEEFKSWAEQGAFLPLDDYEELKKHLTQEQLEEYTLTVNEEDATDEEGATPHLYGLPMSGIKAINEEFFRGEDCVLGVMAYSKNSEKAAEVLQWLAEKGR